METLIKWPGGKSGEIDKFRNLIPTFDRYVEPFFGGGAVFFDLKPKKAIVNDISTNLMGFYELVKDQNPRFHEFLNEYRSSFSNMVHLVDGEKAMLLSAFDNKNEQLISSLSERIANFLSSFPDLFLDLKKLRVTLEHYSIDKFRRTIINNEKKPFSTVDLSENLLTGFTSGYYMYFRDIYNQIALSKIPVSKEYKLANFYFVREYCYGSMFRYNSKGEFNIPYGGMSYNRKNFTNKIDSIFCEETRAIFENTELHNEDFETLLCKIGLNEKDFMFLDPPYDTDFSDYEGREFGKNDQIRLANVLLETKAKIILVIKNTDFIYGLYNNARFNIFTFDKNYTYNVRDRNVRDVEHLIITNF